MNGVKYVHSVLLYSAVLFDYYDSYDQNTYGR